MYGFASLSFIYLLFVLGMAGLGLYTILLFIKAPSIPDDKTYID